MSARNAVAQQQHQLKQPPQQSSSSPPYDVHALTFETLLDADAPVDTAKLRRAAARGIPTALRPRVWNILLGVSASDVSLRVPRDAQYQQLLNSLPSVPQVPDLTKRVRRILGRLRFAPYLLPLPQLQAEPPPLPSSHVKKHDNLRRVVSVSSTDVSTCSRLLSVVLHAYPALHFHDQLVHLCLPFFHLMPTESDVYHAFAALMERHHPLFIPDIWHEPVSHFLSMFRAMYPALYQLFVAEGLDVNKWARDWLRGLLVEQLPINTLLRLWDSYFANPPSQGLSLHPYVCLVFIHHLQSDLHDVDDLDRITAILSTLPPVDVDQVLAHALTLRQQLRDDHHL